MNNEERLAVLTVHREGLEAAKTWEDFRAQQVGFVSFLIDEISADMAREEVVLNWLNQKKV